MGTGAFLVIYDYSHKIKLYFSDSALTSYKIHQEELITNAFVVLNVNFSFKNIDEEIRLVLVLVFVYHLCWHFNHDCKKGQRKIFKIK